MKKNKNINNFIYFAFTLILLTFSDYYFASMIVKRLAQGWVFTSPILNIVYAENTGAAFNILSNSNKLLANLAIVVIFIIFLYLIKNIDKTDKKFLFLLSLFTAGIYGNLYERLTIGYVRDFFEIAFVEFPIFNISDIYITVAVIGLIFTIIFSRKV